MPYPIILGGDHAEFEQEWAASGRPDNERHDWPLPSFDAQDWAKAFCSIANGLGYKDAQGEPIDEGWMIGWFANALMRGFDERAARIPEIDVRCENGCVLRKVNQTVQTNKDEPIPAGWSRIMDRGQTINRHLLCALAQHFAFEVLS